MDQPLPNFALKPLRSIEHDQPLTLARFSPCGKFIFGCDYTATIWRWSVDGDAKIALKGHSGWINGLAFHPDGKQLFTADSWGQVIAWNYADDAPAPKWKTVDCHAGLLRGLAINPDGSTLATCGVDRFVRLWSTIDGSKKQELPQHADELFCVAFHPDGKSLVSGDLKGIATHWDLAAAKAVRQIDAKSLYLRPKVTGFVEINDVGGIRNLSFDPSGTTLACGGCQPITSGFFTGKPLVILIDWASGNQKQSLQPPDAKPEDGVAMDAILHPAGFYVAACSGQSGNGSLWCWKPGEQKPFFFMKESNHFRTVSIHPDGKRLLASHVMPKPGAPVGNGRLVDEKGNYFGLVSTIRIFDTAGEPAPVKA